MTRAKGLWAGILVAGLAALGLSATGCGSAVETAESMGKSSSALSTSLTTRAGTLCFSENTASFHQKVGAPASGFIDINQPQSHAVLGGTGNASNGLNIESDLQFQVTDLRNAWNQAAFGPQRQVCAEIEVQNSCNLERICWQADGHWRLEKKLNAGQTSLLECGSNGESVLAQDDGSVSLPTAFPLTFDATYGLQIGASRTATSTTSSSVQLKFTRSTDSASKVVSLSNVPLAWSNGFSGVRNDRLAIRANLAGMKPAQSGVSSRCGAGVDCQETTASHVQGGVEGLTGPLSCNYGGSYAAPENLRITGSDCHALEQMVLAWSPPANVPPASIAGYRIMRDGYELIAGPRPELTWYDAYNLIGGRTYTYQVGWVDTTGKLRDVATVKGVAPLPCTGTTLADGKLKFAGVFMRFSDAPGPLEPFTMASAYDQLFTVPTSNKAFFSQLSRNTVALEGQVYGWITLPWTVHNRCSYLAPDGTGSGCSFNYDELKTVARQNGVPVDSYEQVGFFVNGNNDGGNSAGGTSVIGLSFGWQGPHLRTDAIAHEMLHNLGQRSHSTYIFCAGSPPTFVPPNLGDMGSCGLFQYGDPYDVMGANMSLLNTMGLFQLNWLQPSEVADGRQGKSYWIGRLGSTVYPTKQLLISLDHPFVYYVEYRTAAGFDGFDPCPTCDPAISKSNIAKQGILVHTWRQDILYNGQVNEFAGVAPVLMGYAGGGVNALPAGAAFRDPYRGLTLNVLEENADGARVNLAWDCTDCPADNTCHGVGCLPATCRNGQHDAGETGVDCGGQCDLCPVNAACNDTGDCQSGLCVYGQCSPASCANNVKDPGEVDVDCGGACAHRCQAGQTCANGADCASNLCQNAICASSCVNGVQDAGETGVDCGGSCPACPPPACNPGSCPGNQVWNCATNHCELPLPGTCVDGQKNNRETDVDCGGGYCSACTENKACSVHADCRAGLSCVGGTCQYAASCHDGVRSGSWSAGESDIDCGGPCAPCVEGKMCRAASDCVRGESCLGGECYALSFCTDQEQMAPETDFNCGGGACPACDDRDACVIPEDCKTGSTCVEGTCRPIVTPATCNDGVKTGPYSTGETSVDCGGPCRPCTTEGAACLTKGDCDENLGLACLGGECWAALASLCSNNRADAYETSVDCGGDFCGPCALDRDCIENSDCQSNLVCISSNCNPAP